MVYSNEITPDNVDYTIGQLALLEASGYKDAGLITSVYAIMVEHNDVLGEARLGLDIETLINEKFYNRVSAT